VPDPYAPKGWPRQVAGERRSELDQFAQRLTDLGAQPDEVQLVRDSWDELDPDDSTDPDAFTAARRAELLRMPDDQLRALLTSSRDEYELGTTSEEEAEAHRQMAAYRLAYAEAGERICGNVDSVLAWVADDPVRAEAVLELEQGPDGADRKTLVGPLRDLLDQEAATDATAAAAGPEPAPGPDAPDGAPEAHSGDQGGPGDGGS
jgi:hypothetical protein